MAQQTLDKIRQLAEQMWEGCHGCDENDREFWINGYITGALSNQIELPSDTAEDTADYIDRHIVEAMVEVAKKPINFPSDEEIEKSAWNYELMKIGDGYNHHFIEGAKWMKEQILNQIK